MTQPEAFFALTLRKAVRLLEPIYVYPEGVPNIMRMTGHILAIALALLTVFGFLAYIFGRLWLRRSELPAVGPLAAFVGLYYVIHLGFLSESRFMAPVFPITLVVAVATILQLVSKRRSRNSGWSVSPQAVQQHRT